MSYRVGSHVVSDEEYQKAQKVSGFDLGEFDLDHLVKHCRDDKSIVLYQVKTWVDLLAKHGYTIEAIKVIRLFFNDGLREAKERVEKIQENQEGKMLKSSLLGREYKIEGTWYAPYNFLKKFKSITSFDLWNTTSSAGDWEGWIVQKLDKNYLIMWSQTNNSRGGFDLLIDEKPLASWKRNVNFTKAEIMEIIAEYENKLVELEKDYLDWLESEEERIRQWAMK